MKGRNGGLHPIVSELIFIRGSLKVIFYYLPSPCDKKTTRFLSATDPSF